MSTHGVVNLSTDSTLCVRSYIVNIELDEQILLMDEQEKQCEINIAKTFTDSESILSFQLIFFLFYSISQ